MIIDATRFVIKVEFRCSICGKTADAPEKLGSCNDDARRDPQWPEGMPKIGEVVQMYWFKPGQNKRIYLTDRPVSWRVKNLYWKITDDIAGQFGGPEQKSPHVLYIEPAMGHKFGEPWDPKEGCSATPPFEMQYSEFLIWQAGDVEKLRALERLAPEPPLKLWRRRFLNFLKKMTGK